MAADTDRIAELEQETTRLSREVERYRTAAEDALQQLDWCIGYFAGSHKGTVSRRLGANRAHIRRNLLGRTEQPLPSTSPGDGGSGST